MQAPLRENYLDRLNVRNKGVDRWVLWPRRRLWIQAGLVFLAIAVLVGAAVYLISTCSFVYGCGEWLDVSASLLFIGAGILGLFLAFHLVLVAARWTHNHRAAEWELTYGERLDALEEQIGKRIDMPAESHKTRDLLGATVTGDFLGERIHVRADFWNGVAIFSAVPAAFCLLMMFLFLWVGEPDAEMWLVFALPALPFVIGFRLASKRTRRLADVATQKHLETLQKALDQKWELPSPTYAPYARSGKNVQGKA